MDRQRPARLRGDDGTAAVEFALALPILALFALGTVEMGFRFRDGTLLNRAVSNSARVVSQMANSRNADFEGLRTFASVFAGNKRSTVQRIVIYLPDANGDMTATCKTTAATGSAAGQSGACNVYSASQMNATSPVTGFNSGAGCAGSWDASWCSSTRVPGTTKVGLYAEVQFSTWTKLFGTNIKLQRQAVYVLEPVSVGSS